MHYNFIEIGCADFDTLVGNCSDDTVGISVEPVRCYFERLPRKPHVRTVRAAIDRVAAQYGWRPMYFQRREIIAQYELPFWVGGCHCLGQPHPTVVNLLAELGLPQAGIIEQERVPVITLRDLCVEYDVESLGYLKLDMEGMDTGVLLSSLGLLRHIRPQNIEFEHNELSERSLYLQLHCELQQLGYRPNLQGTFYELV